MPEASPLTVEKGWDYYKNLGSSDFVKVFNFQKSFSSYRFWSNWSSKDLYFIGLRTTVDLQAVENFEAVTSIFDQWVANQNHRPAHQLMNLAASIGGDAGISLVNRSADFLRSLKKSSDRG